MNETSEPGRQPRRDPLRRARRLADPRDQLRAGAERGGARGRSRRDRAGGAAAPSSSASAGRRTRSTTSTIAGRRIFWVAACAGIIVFGSLMAAMFVSQQYLQNVLGYSTLEAGSAILPAALVMVVVAPRSAKLVEARGARFTLLVRLRLPLRRVPLDAARLERGLAVLADRGSRTSSSAPASASPARPASHSLTGSVPVTRAGMASGTADLQRDLGGAIMQSIFGALLTAGYAAAVSAQIAASDQNVTDSTQAAADEVVRRRRGGRRAAPAVRGRDHRRREAGVPRRRRLGVHRRRRRDPPRRGARLLHVPEARRGEAAARRATTRRRRRRPMTWSLGFRLRRYLRESLWVIPLRRRRARVDARRRLDGPRLARRRLDDAGSTRRRPPKPCSRRWSRRASGLVGFVVTVSVLIVQMSTNTFSARYMRIFYRDRAFKAVLAVLIGTFTFSYTLMRHVEEDDVPNLGVTLAGAFLGLGILLFVVFLDRAIHRLRPVAVAALVARAGTEGAAARCSRKRHAPTRPRWCRRRQPAGRARARRAHDPRRRDPGDRLPRPREVGAREREPRRAAPSRSATSSRPERR